MSDLIKTGANHHKVANITTHLSLRATHRISKQAFLDHQAEDKDKPTKTDSAKKKESTSEPGVSGQG